MNKGTQRLLDFQTKKSVHVNLSRATHSDYRKKLFDYSLSMQEVFELFAKLVGEGDKRAESIVQEAYDNKKRKIIGSFNEIETKDLYDAISEE